MAQTIKIGDAGSLILNAYMIESVACTRRSAIDHVQTYQHKSAAADDVHFLDVYGQDLEKAAAARSAINWNPAITPEMTLDWGSLDAIIVLDDTNPNKESGDRIITGLVISRFGIPAGKAGKTRVIVCQKFAENGNKYWQHHEVSSLPYEQIPWYEVELDRYAEIDELNRLALESLSEAEMQEAIARAKVLLG